MKKLSLAVILVAAGISLVGCTNSGTVNTSNKITIEQAEDIALKHAGLTKDQVSFSRTEKDIDNKVEKYDIEFHSNGKEYDYEINAIDGTIIQYDNDIDKYNNQNNSQSNTQNNTQNNTQGNTQGSLQNNSVNNISNANNTSAISQDKAEQNALSHAGLTSNQVNFKRVELDFDNGVQKYDVEFYYNNREYSYEIDANTGAILSYEQD